MTCRFPLLSNRGAVIPRFGVCYIASDGYLFQTVVSALQARDHVGAEVGVYIASIGDPSSEEARVFRGICESSGIDFVDADVNALDGLHPMYARLFLDQFLPEDVEEILYLDGDTQILGDLDPLLRAEVPPGGIIAARDPMVFMRTVDARLGEKIDGWWDKSAIPARLRPDYINSGVIRFSRSALPGIRARCLEMVADGRAATLQFHDQDAINLALDGRVSTLSMSWNYPGFLLNTPIARVAPPRIVHFMSNPRPWNAPFWPWGEDFFRPYRQFVDRFPQAAPYWQRMQGAKRARYVAQQFVKRMTERRQWNSPAASSAVERISHRDLVL